MAPCSLDWVEIPCWHLNSGKNHAEESRKTISTTLSETGPWSVSKLMGLLNEGPVSLPPGVTESYHHICLECLSFDKGALVFLNLKNRLGALLVPAW